MLISLGILKNTSKKSYSPLLFFNLMPKMVFGSLIGFFLHLMLMSAVLMVLFTQSSDYQLFFYSSLGFVVFSVSFLMYSYSYFETLKVPSYKSFLISSNKLIVWIWWTFNAWLLSCWAAMVFIGLFNGFFWSFMTSTEQLVLTAEPEITKLTGMVLWVVHWFLIAMLGISYKKAKEVFSSCQSKLWESKNQLSQFKLKAEEEVSVQTIPLQ